MNVSWTNHRGGKFRFRSFATRGLPGEVRFHLGTDRFPATLTAPGRRGRLMVYAGVELDIPTVARYVTPDDGDWLIKAAMWSPIAGDTGGVGLIAYREGQDGGFERRGRDPVFDDERYGIFPFVVELPRHTDTAPRGENGENGMTESSEVARTIQALTGYEHADTLRGEPNDFHAEAVSLDPDAPIAVRATAGTLILDDIEAALVGSGGYDTWMVEGPPDEDYGNAILVVRRNGGRVA